MGDIADDHIDRMMDDYPSWSPFRSARKYRDPYHVTCKYCGATGLKWREDSDGFRLYENERGPHNRLVEHSCQRHHESNPLDGFEDIS